MPVRWSVLALSLCWLGPFAHEIGRNEPLPGNDFDQPRPALRVESLLGHAGSASHGTLTVAAGFGDSQDERGHAASDYHGLFRHLFVPRFPFRDQRRHTRYGNVPIAGIRAGDGAVVNSLAATDTRR